MCVLETNTRVKIILLWLTIICILVLLIQSCSSELEIITIDVHKANLLLRKGGYRFLDVRTTEEFMKGHVDFDDALNIPYMLNAPQGRVINNKFLEQILPLCNKDDQLIVGCQSGVRSVYATNILLEAGFKHVYNMGGGYLAWVENDLPVAMLTLAPKLEL
ncbi:thiosulfate sulfurtransferase 18-like protein [Tanacetum coccineum]